MSSIPLLTISRAAWATAIAGFFALAFIILFFTLGQPFGTLNDICIGLTAMVSIVLVWTLYPQYRSPSPLVGQAALVLAVIGSLAAVAGSVLVIFRFTGWYLAGLYSSAGFALVGLWLFGLNFFARSDPLWPRGLVNFGMVIGFIMALGLAGIPGIFRGIDAWEAAPWYVNYIGQMGGLGWLVLYPFWCIWLARITPAG